MEPIVKKHTYQQRSEEVQEILSRPPSWIVRWGSGLFFIFMAVLLGIAWLIPSPTVITGSVKVATQPFDLSLPVANDPEFMAVALLSQDKFGKIHTGQKAVIKLDAYNYRDFGVLEGNVIRISDKFDPQQGYFEVWISLPQDHNTTRQQKVQYLSGLKGNADIVVSERRLIQKLSPF